MATPRVLAQVFEAKYMKDECKPNRIGVAIKPTQFLISLSTRCAQHANIYVQIQI